MTDDESKMIRLKYSDEESGWAEDLGDGKYRIANLPLTDGLNIDDVVTVTSINGWLTIDRVIEQPFPIKTLIRYDEIKQHKQILSALKKVGCKCEGFLAPDPKFGRGMIGVAAPSGVDPRDIVEKLGISQDADE